MSEACCKQTLGLKYKSAICTQQGLIYCWVSLREELCSSRPTLLSDSEYFLLPMLTMSSISSAMSLLPLSIITATSLDTDPGPAFFCPRAQWKSMSSTKPPRLSLEGRGRINTRYICSELPMDWRENNMWNLTHKTTLNIYTVYTDADIIAPGWIMRGFLSRKRRRGWRGCTDEHQYVCNPLQCPRWLSDGWQCRLKQSKFSSTSLPPQTLLQSHKKINKWCEILHFVPGETSAEQTHTEYIAHSCRDMNVHIYLKLLCSQDSQSGTSVLT